MCGEKGVVCVFVEKQEVSGRTERSVCVYVGSLGWGCGELRDVEQEMGVCWGAGLERWGSGEGDWGVQLCVCMCGRRDGGL